MASIESPFVIEYKEAFFDNNTGELWLVMEHADDKDLYAKIKDHKVSR